MKPKATLFALAIASAMLFPFPAVCGDTGEILIADFEGGDYGGWTARGEAFGTAPARGTLPNQMEVSGFEGEGLANSFRGGDGATGSLASPPFKIRRPYINFLLGGGMHPGEACVNLIVDGETVRTATGPNERPGGSERLDWHTWDVREFAGREAVIAIMDEATGGWGHINVDHIVQSEDIRQAMPAEIRLGIEKTYLHLPVKNGAPKRRMAFVFEGETAREFDIELADGEPDFWVFSDATAFMGGELTIRVDALPHGSKGLSSIKPSDEVPGGANLYHETYRPQFHFTSRRGWNNDPNGLVYYDGEYHLYYQHNPYGWSWGNMHWGHAVSADLTHWEELPIALYPQEYGDWCFSGGALVDEANTAGFQTGEEKVIVAAYTSTGRGECIAYSNDRGRTFTEYAGNPVVEQRGRDPKIIWHEPTGMWAMAVYDEADDSRGIAFYTSPDLKTWKRESRIDGYYECPELFEIAVDGDPANTKWVVYAADGAYAIGYFDGKRFEAETDKIRFNWGNCFYASQTYSNIPAEDGRRIQIAWGRTGHPDMPFNQMMNYPVELTLRNTDEGLRLFANPVAEIEGIHKRGYAWGARSVRPGQNPWADIEGELFDIRVAFRPGDAEEVRFDIRGESIVYDAKRETLTCGDHSAPLAPLDGVVSARFLVDRLSIEIFGNEGRMYMPMGMAVDPENRSLSLEAVGGAIGIESMAVHTLRSIW